MKLKDFTPTKETISLHGLGFIQVLLEGKQRLHVWHPDLPRRDCYKFSAVHNHRFSFTSRVLKGVQKNQRVDVELEKEVAATHYLISHNGPRSEKGGRISYPVAHCNLFYRDVESYFPGGQYRMEAFEYHHTPCTGIVVTIIQKEAEHEYCHANSICEIGTAFHYDFDRFQLSPKQLFEFVVDALAS